MPTTLFRRSTLAKFAIPVAALVGCGGKGGVTTTSASATTSAPTASASVSAAPPPRTIDDTPKGKGFTEVVPASKAGCKPEYLELATYLLRGELTIAGRAGKDPKIPAEFAAAWLVQLPDGAQIGFGGYDGQARKIAKVRGIGKAHDNAPHLFATGDRWTVAWFDDRGLAYAYPEFESSSNPAIQHFGAPTLDPAKVAFALDPAGVLVVASPFGTSDNQLSVFVFGASPKGVGLTKAAVSPVVPAVAADKTGYSLVWLEAAGQIMAQRFNLEGAEVGPATILVDKGGTQRTNLQMVSVEGGSLLTWVEGDKVLARRLDDRANVAGDVIVVGTGKHPAVEPTGKGAVVAMLSTVEGAADQLVLVRTDGLTSPASAILASDGKQPVLDPPALAVAPTAVALTYTVVMSTTISSKRAWLATLNRACLKE
ncbi:MAG: hypothetical protein U0271_43570 [Polyangiaceae bacterium]